MKRGEITFFIVTMLMVLSAPRSYSNSENPEDPSAKQAVEAEVQEEASGDLESQEHTATREKPIRSTIFVTLMQALTELE